jgi:FkbM family methyltransferase
MIHFFKKILYRILGQSAYLKTLHIGFVLLYDWGLLKKDPAYKYHYFVKHLVKEGDCVVDIGANLGYFSKIFSRLVKKTGRVICVEPVPPFFSTLQWALRNKTNCTLHNKALGLENKTVTMNLPKLNGQFRTGLAHIANAATDGADDFTFEVELVRGSSLLADLPAIHLIKCDIEGYEEYVLPEIKAIIAKHRPIIQVETWGTHIVPVHALMQELGYIEYRIYQNKMVKDMPAGFEFGDSDYLFIHNSAEAALVQKLRAVGAV